MYRPIPVLFLPPFLTRLFALQKSTLPPGEGIKNRAEFPPCFYCIFDIGNYIIILLYGDYIPLIFRIITPIIEMCQGGIYMIRFDRLWKTMEQKKISTYQLREHCGIDSKTVRRLKANENMETKTLNKLCAFLDCKLDDIAEFIPD